MATCHTLLLKCADTGADDRTLRQAVASLAIATALPIVRQLVARGLAMPEVYAYLELAAPMEVTAGDIDSIIASAGQLPPMAGTSPVVDRLQRQFEPAAASAGRPAPYHYVVETDPAPGWRDELLRWYDTEHMPGLARVSGCVRAQRYINDDHGPLSLACYDLEQMEATTSAAWLAVRATAWSDRVRPQFRNTRRTMFRLVDGAPSGPAVM